MTKAADIRLNGRVALVTGAAKGLGRAMAQALCRAGADVVFADMDAGATGSAVAPVAFRDGCGKAIGLPCDITDPHHCERTINETQRLFGRLDILVNNAGKGPAHLEQSPGTKSKRFWESDLPTWREIIETNVLGTYYMSRFAAPIMIAQGWGRIINITTSLSTMQRRENSPYGVSKTAIEAETLIWAQDLAGTGVSCNSLIPGGAVNTDFVSAREKEEAAATGRVLLEPEVMQAPVVWLASPMSDGITGKRYVGKFWQPDADVKEAQQAALEASVLLPPDRA
jgi:3-oxoacyl-[acyl-carrier protein] reductase